MSYNIIEYVVRLRFNGLQYVKMVKLFQTVFIRSTNEAFKRTYTHIPHAYVLTHARTYARIHVRTHAYNTNTHTHTRTHGNTDECKMRECSELHFAKRRLQSSKIYIKTIDSPPRILKPLASKSCRLVLSVRFLYIAYARIGLNNDND